MASGTGSIASRTPTRIIPPAIPKMPERNDVPTMVRHKAAIRSGLMARGSALRMIPAAAQGKLSYRTLSISFPDACHI
jgi:hypothetical protein